jgi:hypothetical protein
MSDNTNEAHKCAGFRKSWPWEGYPCGAWAKYGLDGKWYCGQHYAVEVEIKKAPFIISGDDLELESE